jgi:hypothetical protein
MALPSALPCLSSWRSNIARIDSLTRRCLKKCIIYGIDAVVAHFGEDLRERQLSPGRDVRSNRRQAIHDRRVSTHCGWSLCCRNQADRAKKFSHGLQNIWNKRKQVENQRFFEARPRQGANIEAAQSGPDRVPRRGVADGWTMTISGLGRIGQMATAGNPTIGSSHKAAMVSSVMQRARWAAHSSCCSNRMAPT